MNFSWYSLNWSQLLKTTTGKRKTLRLNRNCKKRRGRVVCLSYWVPATRESPAEFFVGLPPFEELENSLAITPSSFLLSTSSTIHSRRYLYSSNRFNFTLFTSATPIRSRHISPYDKFEIPCVCGWLQSVVEFVFVVGVMANFIFIYIYSHYSPIGCIISFDDIFGNRLCVYRVFSFLFISSLFISLFFFFVLFFHRAFLIFNFIPTLP